MKEKIEEARRTNPMRGERRTVTMLFADIKGSTAAAEGLDPEDWSEIINGAFEHMIAPVYRYEGTLARLMGDAVLAFFGAPIAHEDDPVRAVRAGLEIADAMGGYKAEISRRWGIDIDVRVGINTGLVVVGEVGSDLRVEYTALGDAVNVAARMEQTADPGTVRVTAETWSLVSDQFEGESIGGVEVKGKSEPVEAVRVLSRRSGRPSSVERAMIGRASELGELQSLRPRLEAGAGWVASIMGEAGLGKSCLLAAFRSSMPKATVMDAPEADGRLAWLSAFNESYDSSIPYSCVRQLLRRWWDVDGAEDPYQTVEPLVTELLPDLSDAAAYLGHVASLPLPDSVSDFLGGLQPPVLDGRVQSAVLSYLGAEAARRPLVVAVEDIHWADPKSLGLIEELLQLTETVPVGVLFTMRPYRDEPAWHVHEVAQRDHPHRYHPIDLSYLEPDAARALFDRLVDGSNVPAELRERILTRSEGNPLFIEQMARAMGEAGGPVVTATVPTGLRSLLTARLDRLGPESKLVAQMASVIGNEFNRTTLVSLVGQDADLNRSLVDLLRREIFVESRDEAGVLGFHHALMQEAAYSTILLRHRRQLHARLAHHLVETAPDAVQEIARHFMEADEADHAFPYLVAAGEQASRSMALSDAIRLFATALDNIPAEADPELVIRGHDGLGLAYTLVPDLSLSEATYQRLLDYADSSDRPSAKVTALNRMAMNTAALAGDFAGAQRYLDQAKALALEVGDEFGLAEYHMNACSIAGMGGDVGTAAFHDEETVRQGEEMGVDSIRLEGLSRLAANRVWLMDFDQAMPVADEAMDAARKAGDEHSVALLNALVVSQLEFRKGDRQAALDLAVISETTLGRYASYFTPLVWAQIAQYQYELGRIEEALDKLQSVQAMGSFGPNRAFVAVALARRARVYATLGMEQAMNESRSMALEAGSGSLGAYMISTVWAEVGTAARALGDLSAAEADFDQGLQVSSASMYWEKPRLLIGKARVRAALDDPAEAHRLLDEAQTFLLDKEVRAYDAHLEHARGEALLAEGNAEEAIGRLASALDVARAEGLRIFAIEISATAARAATALGDGEAARKHTETARADMEEVAKQIADPELKSAFITAWSTRLGLTTAD